MMQKILDHRLGIDRERLDEIEKEMEDIMKNPNLSDEEKKLMLDALEEEKQAKEFVAREKNAAGQQQITQQVSQIKIQGELNQDQPMQAPLTKQTQQKQPTQQQSEMLLEALITNKYRGQKVNQVRLTFL